MHVHCSHYVHAHTYSCVMEINLSKCLKQWKWWRWFEMFGSDWGWDIDQRKMIPDTKREPSGMARGSSREKVGGGGRNRWGGLNPHTEQRDWQLELMNPDGWQWHHVSGYTQVSSTSSMQVQANITLEFQKEWKHCSTLSCVLYGKSRRKTCRPFLPVFYSFSFSH